MQKYIHTQTDAHGDIAVIDIGEQRILSFGEGDEQSLQLKAQPELLQHPYTQAMMISLLFCTPKRVLLLGLGAGSLLNSLHHTIPGVRIEAVELRQGVIDVAKKYFRLVSGKKIQLHCQGAREFLKVGVEKKVDLLMTDLYTYKGMDDTQVSGEFIDLCAQQLKVNGWLVINCWGTTADHKPLFQHLGRIFADVRSCESGDGNLVIFAGRQKDLKSQAVLKEMAARQALTLGFNLSRYLTHLESYIRSKKK